MVLSKKEAALHYQGTTAVQTGPLNRLQTRNTVRTEGSASKFVLQLVNRVSEELGIKSMKYLNHLHCNLVVILVILILSSGF